MNTTQTRTSVDTFKIFVIFLGIGFAIYRFIIGDTILEFIFIALTILDVTLIGRQLYDIKKGKVQKPIM